MAVPISRNSESSVADWMLKASLPNIDKKEAADAAHVSTDDDLVAARVKIEECAKTGKPFFFESNVDQARQRELKEYAVVCGMDQEKVIPVTDTEKALAAEKPVEAPPEVPDRDPFGVIDSFADSSAFEKNRDWDKVKPAEKVSGRGQSGGSVTRSGGIEQYEDQRVVGVRPGEASIAAPDSIQELAEKEEKSSREVITEANAERKDKITFKTKEWEKDITDNLPDPGTMAKGGVKLTDVGYGQPHTMVGQGQHSIFDMHDKNESIPDKTRGEALAETNEERKASIQRGTSKDRSWDRPISSKKPVVSDLLYEELKKRMGVKADG